MAPGSARSSIGRCQPLPALFSPLRLFFSFFDCSLSGDLLCFRAVVLEVLSEPFVLQGFVGRNALLWIVDKNLLEQVEELAVEVAVWRDRFLRT